VVAPTSQSDKLVVDLGRARAVAKTLESRFAKSGPGISGQRPPESTVPAGVARDSREHILLLTLTVAVDYMRDADQLWRAARNAFEAPGTRYLFDPAQVIAAGRDRVTADLKRTGIGRKTNRDGGAWFTICETLATKWGNDPSNFLANCDYHAATIIRRLKADYHDVDGKPVPDYPLLRGPKIAPLWIRILRDNAGVQFKGLDEVAIPVDIHVLRATICAGALVGSYEGDKTTLLAKIREVWRDATQGLRTTTDKPMVALDIDEALWTLSRECCSARGVNLDGPNRSCPLAPVCATGKIDVDGPQCRIETG